MFPLPGALLLPWAKLPLNVFEPRYLALTEDALCRRRMFGMIQPDAAAPERQTGPSLFHVGCLGRLSSFEETDDGRYLITVTGLIRFEVVEERAPRRGYRTVAGNFTPFAADLDSELETVAMSRTDLLKDVRAYFNLKQIEANWDAIERMPDDALVVALSMVCPFEPAEKQALLEAKTMTERAEVLRALLQMGGLEASSGIS